MTARLDERLVERLHDILQNIADIRRLVGGKNRSDVESDRVQWAAFERFLEIISEASRHIPQEVKQDHGPEIPWRQIADIGNVLRHGYHAIANDRIWAILDDHLEPLEPAVHRMVRAIRGV